MSERVFRFEVLERDGGSSARRGRIVTARGTIATPAFMPVATAGAVRGVTPEELRRLGAEIVLANAYHLSLRPGAEVIRDLGGLSAFMGWNGPGILSPAWGPDLRFSAAIALPISSTIARGAPTAIRFLIVEPTSQ